MSVLDGLEFRVAFGDVWKDNLSELSGGQRYGWIVGYRHLISVAESCVRANSVECLLASTSEICCVRMLG